MLSDLIQIYVILGCLWGCWMMLFIDRVPDVFLNLRQRVQIMFTSVVTWPIWIPLWMVSGFKPTARNEALWITFYSNREWFLDLFVEVSPQISDEMLTDRLKARVYEILTYEGVNDDIENIFMVLCVMRWCTKKVKHQNDQPLAHLLKLLPQDFLNTSVKI